MLYLFFDRTTMCSHCGDGLGPVWLSYSIIECIHVMGHYGDGLGPVLLPYLIIECIHVMGHYGDE